MDFSGFCQHNSARLSVKTCCCYPMVFIAFILMPAFVSGQESENSIDQRIRISEITMLTGYGEGKTDDGIYRHILMSCNIGFHLPAIFPQPEYSRGVFSFFVEPMIDPILGPETGVEFGMSLGIKYRIPLSDTWHSYFIGAVGPHYITVETENQADGFIFFNSIGAGLSFFLTEKSAINLEYRFRHASNASTHEPNGGIDSHIGAVGYTIFF